MHISDQFQRVRILFQKQNAMVYKWLDDQEFNRLALSGPGHQQFDGTGRGGGRGHGRRAKTNPMITAESNGVNIVMKDGVAMAAMGVRLWC